MTLEINMGRPSLSELLEISESSEYRIFTKPHGRISELGKKIIGKAVPWKKIEGEAYKTVKTKTGKVLYDVQQDAADIVRKAAASDVGKTYTRGMHNIVKGESIVLYTDGEYGIEPHWSALLGMHGRKKRISKIVATYDTKAQCIAHLPITAKRQLEMAQLVVPA